MTSFALALATLVLGAGPASAARILYVTSNGTDTGVCGPVSRPCRSIGEAVANASSGDRILVAPGVYGNFVLAKAVTIESTHGAGATIIQGPEPVIDVAAGAAGAVIGRPSKGLTIRGADVGIQVFAPDVVIEDSIFSGVRLGVVAEFAALGLTVTGSVFAPSGAGSTAIVARGGASAVVQNVIQAEPGGRGAVLTGEGGVFSDNVVAGADIGLLVRAAVATVRRNTFSANAVGINFPDVAGAVSRVVTANNFTGNGNELGNCGVLDDGGQPALVTGNYWGSPGGPGAHPADEYCGLAGVTTPFLRAPVSVAAPAGR
jgi:nitrous oxidase accessory protein NosD